MTVLPSKTPKQIGGLSSKVALSHAKNTASGRSKAPLSAKPKPAYKANRAKKSRGSLEGLVRKRNTVLEHNGTGYSSRANQKARFRSNTSNVSRVSYGKLNSRQTSQMHHTDITMRPRRNR